MATDEPQVGGIDGVVTLAPQGTAINGRVVVEAMSQETYEITSSESDDGRFRLEGLSPGTYWVTVWCTECYMTQIEIEVREGVTATTEIAAEPAEDLPGPRRLSPCSPIVSGDLDHARERLSRLEELGLTGHFPEPFSRLSWTLAARAVMTDRFVETAVVSVYRSRNRPIAEIMSRQRDPAGSDKDTSIGVWRAPFSTDLAERLRALFSSAIMTLSYDDGSRMFTTHGTTYEFLADVPSLSGIGCGRLYAPERLSPTITLPRLGSALFEYPKAEDVDRPKLELDLEELLSRAERSFVHRSDE